jgi:hypothetical protein
MEYLKEYYLIGLFILLAYRVLTAIVFSDRVEFSITFLYGPIVGLLWALNKKQ